MNRRVLSLSLLAALWGAWPLAQAQKAAATVGALGRIQPQGGIVALAPPQAGLTIDRVLVREGDAVRKGDVLVTFAERSLREMETSVAAERVRTLDESLASRVRLAELERDSSQQNLAAARADLQAVEALDPLTVAPRERRLRAQQVASAESALRVAEARLAEVRRTVEPERRSARQQLEVARAQLVRSQLVAPMDGTVIEVPARAGTVASGALVSVADLSVIQVVADVFEGDLARIAVGAKARVSNGAIGQIGGSVERIGRQVDAGSRLAKVTLRLDQPAPADRYLGMQVDVSIDAK